MSKNKILQMPTSHEVLHFGHHMCQNLAVSYVFGFHGIILWISKLFMYHFYLNLTGFHVSMCYCVYYCLLSTCVKCMWSSLNKFKWRKLKHPSISSDGNTNVKFTQCKSRLTCTMKHCQQRNLFTYGNNPIGYYRNTVKQQSGEM